MTDIDRCSDDYASPARAQGKTRQESPHTRPSRVPGLAITGTRTGHHGYQDWPVQDQGLGHYRYRD